MLTYSFSLTASKPNSHPRLPHDFYPLNQRHCDNPLHRHDSRSPHPTRHPHDYAFPPPPGLQSEYKHRIDPQRRQYYNTHSRISYHENVPTRGGYTPHNRYSNSDGTQDNDEGC